MPLVATSSIPTVKTNVLALLAAAGGALTGVQLEWAHPGNRITQESVYFTGKVDQSEEGVLLGSKRRTEDYDLTLVVDVQLDGDDAQACELRGWAIVAAIENVLRANTDATGAIQGGWIVITAIVPELYMPDGGWLWEALVTLHVKSHK